MTTRATRANWTLDAPFSFAVGIEDTFIPKNCPGNGDLTSTS